MQLLFEATCTRLVYICCNTQVSCEVFHLPQSVFDSLMSQHHFHLTPPLLTVPTLKKKIQMIIEDFILLHPNQKKLVCFLCVRPQQKYMHAFTITSAITTTFCHTQILKRIQMIIEDFNLLQPNQIKFIRFFNVKL